MYRDTLDSQVEDEYFGRASPGIWNLEFKTLRNGLALNRERDILHALQEVSTVVEGLSDDTHYADKQFGAKNYKSALLSQDWEAASGIEYKYPRGTNLLLVKKSAGYKLVRPQITYQLPLSCLPYLFRHLYILGGKKEMRDFFNKPENMDRIKNLHRALPKPVDGLILLFDYYVDRFICNRHSATEPGLKPSFSMISRISFTDMYRHLAPEEQEIFKQYVMDRYDRFECRGCDYLDLEDKTRPLVRAVEEGIKDTEKYQREIDVLTKKLAAPPERETQEAMEFYRQRYTQTMDLVTRHNPKVEEYKRILSQTLQKRFGDPVKVRYAINQVGVDTSLAMIDAFFSVKELLDSITQPDFRKTIDIEESGRFVRKEKQSDLFSCPFSKLDEDYSMGALPHPESKEALAVVEIRSYPSILRDISIFGGISRPYV